MTHFKHHTCQHAVTILPEAAMRVPHLRICLDLKVNHLLTAAWLKCELPCTPVTSRFIVFDGYLNFKAAIFEPISAGAPSSPGPINSLERELRSWLAPDLLLLEDLALAVLSAPERTCSGHADAVNKNTLVLGEMPPRNDSKYSNGRFDVAERANKRLEMSPRSTSQSPLPIKFQSGLCGPCRRVRRRWCPRYHRLNL